MADEALKERIKRVARDQLSEGGDSAATRIKQEARRQLNVPQPSDITNSASGVNALPGAVTATPVSNFQQLYGRQAGGEQVPIETTTGFMENAPLEPDDAGLAPVGKYWRLAKQSGPEAQVAVLQKMYPGRAVRILDTGDVTLEVTDGATGKVKDVVLNPTGIDPHDLLDLTAQAPEIAAQIATALATKGRGFLRTTAQMMLSAITGGVVGTARDIGARQAENIPVRGDEIVRERGAQALLSLGGEAALGGLGKASRAFSPFARDVKPGSLAFNMTEGLNALREGYDLNLKVTPAERTGSKMLMAAEAAESPMPGARNVFDKIAADREAALQDLQQTALRGLKPNEEIGAEAIGQLRQEVVEPLEWAFNDIRERALTKGNKRIVDLIDDVVPGARGRITPTDAGNVAMQQFERRIAQANALRDEAYAKVRALPGGSGAVLVGDPAATAAAEIRAELPAVLKDVEQPTDLVDQFGRPGTRTVERRVELKGGEPDLLEKALLDMEELKGGRVSLSTLTELKNRAHDAIAAFRTAHGDVKDRWFSRIAGGYEDAIQAGIDATENLELKQALAEARDTYKKEVLPLERPGIKELAKDEFDPGNLSPEQVVERFFEGPKAIKNFGMLKEVLGPADPALHAIKRAWVDTKLANVTDDLTGKVKPDQLRQLFKNLRDEKPELARELFGEDATKLEAALRTQTALNTAAVNQPIDAAELHVLLNLKNPGVDDLRALLRMGANRDKAYLNQIFANVRDEAIEPTKFVGAIRNTDIPTKDVEAALAQLKPETRDAIATAEFYRILSEGSTKQGETAARAFAGQPVNLSPTKIVEAFGDTPEKRARTALLLGDGPAPGSRPPRIAQGGEPQVTGMTRGDTLLAIVKTLAPKEATKTAFSGLGSVASATAIRQITRGPMTYASNTTKNWLIALLYTTKLGEQLTNRVWDGEGSALLANTLIASEPFLRASVDAFGKDWTKRLVAEAKDSIDRYVMEFNDSPAGRKRQATRQFLQGQQVPMRMGTQSPNR